MHMCLHRLHSTCVYMCDHYQKSTCWSAEEAQRSGVVTRWRMACGKCGHVAPCAGPLCCGRTLTCVVQLCVVDVDDSMVYALEGQEAVCAAEESDNKQRWHVVAYHGI